MPSLVVLLRGDGTESDQRRTIDALERHTTALGLCLFNSNAVDAGATIDAALARDDEILVIGWESTTGPVTNQIAWDVVQRAPDADVILLERGWAVGPEWHERLRTAAYKDPIVATSSAVPAGMLALHDRSSARLRLPDDGSVRGAALGEPLWGCVYVRRDALNIAIGARWFADYRQNGSQLRLEDVVLVPGLVHVLAAVVVESPSERPEEQPAVLTPSVRRALAEIETAVEPLRVTLDLRCFAFPPSGTHVHAMNLVGSLAAREALRLSILVPARPDESAHQYLEALPPSVTCHTEGQRIVPPPHVFHRPYQVLTESEIADVVTSGARLVLTHQDMILDRTPAYFPSRDQWRHYTAASALTFIAADEVVFFSEHSRREALRDGLVDESKTSVVPPGTDHLGALGDESVPSALVGRFDPESPAFVLVIGNAYIHKNRLFALRVTSELRQSHGWNGTIVFAGGTPGDGSSESDESEFLRNHGQLNSRFVALPHVTDAERHWLYKHAVLVLFPTLYEGFGLVPFEAAAVGTPCVYSSRSSVAEFLPPHGALLDLRDVVGTAGRLVAVLESAEARETIVRAISVAGRTLTWSRTADAYIEIYHRAMSRPIGLSLVSGREVVVGASSLMATSQTERRVLVAIRRSATVRRIANAVVSATAAVGRVGQRFSRGAGS